MKEYSGEDSHLYWDYQPGDNMSTPTTALSASLTGLISHHIDDILDPFKETLYDESISGMLRLLKVHFAVTANFRNALAGFQQGMAFPDPIPEYGVSPTGIIDAIINTLYATAVTSALLGEEVGEELWMEMIQEGVSNAFQTSLGGSLQTYMNIYRGGLPPSIDDISDMPFYWDWIDDKLLGFILASAGGNLYTTLHYGLRGIQNYLNQNYMNATNQIQILATRLIEDYLWHKNYYLELRRDALASYIRAILMYTEYVTMYANDIAETAISRLTDMLNELETNKKAYDNGLINDDMFHGIIESIKASYEALMNDINNMITSLTSIIISEVIEIPQEVVDEYKAALQELSNEYAKIIEALNTHYEAELRGKLDRLFRGLEYLWAYRSYNIYRKQEQYPENWQLPLKKTYLEPYKLKVTVKGRPQQ